MNDPTLNPTAESLLNNWKRTKKILAPLRGEPHSYISVDLDFVLGPIPEDGITAIMRTLPSRNTNNRPFLFAVVISENEPSPMALPILHYTHPQDSGRWIPAAI